MILAVLLYYRQLLSYTLYNTVQSTSDCYLADLYLLLNNKSLSNQRTLFERVEFSFLQVLTIFENRYKSIIQLLTVVFNKSLLFLKLFDRLTNQYIVDRIKNRVSYLSVRTKNLIKQILELSIDISSLLKYQIYLERLLNSRVLWKAQ